MDEIITRELERLTYCIKSVRLHAFRCLVLVPVYTSGFHLSADNIDWTCGAPVCWQPPVSSSKQSGLQGERVLTGNSPLTALLNGEFCMTARLHATLEITARA